MQFKVVPFRGQIRATKDSLDTASKQLEDVINSHVQKGWTFHSLGSIHITVQPGCLAGLFGQTASTVVYDQVIFTAESRPRVSKEIEQ